MACQHSVPSVVNLAALPDGFPTHRHKADFWEALGRTIATFGFMEEVLARAIFALTATRPYDEAEAQKAYAEWLPKLERALSDPLGGLIAAYEKAMRDHPDATADDLPALVKALRNASDLRNVLCHGSWRAPNPDGASTPLFVDRKRRVFITAIDVSFLGQVQRHAAELTCDVMSTVTRMGWRFPGGTGPGNEIWAIEPE